MLHVHCLSLSVAMSLCMRSYRWFRIWHKLDATVGDPYNANEGKDNGVAKGRGIRFVFVSFLGIFGCFFVFCILRDSDTIINNKENAHSSRFTRAEGSRGLKRILLQKAKLAVFLLSVLFVFDSKLSHFLSAILCCLLHLLLLFLLLLRVSVVRCFCLSVLKAR